MSIHVKFDLSDIMMVLSVFISDFMKKEGVKMIQMIDGELEQVRLKHVECLEKGYHDLALKYVELEKELMEILERMKEVEN